jgi:hypothetical protein
MFCAYRNTIIGYRGGYNLTTGTDNTIVGYNSFTASSLGAANTIIGRGNFTSGAYNPSYLVALGTNIQQNASISCSVGIGKDVVMSASNYLFLGSTGSILGQKITCISTSSSKYWKVYINGVLECVLLK